MANKQAAVLLDLISSRKFQDQDGMILGAQAALERVNEQVQALQPLQLTIGDEAQGAYASVGRALRATFLTRLELKTAGLDLRIGIGWGEITTPDPSSLPLRQSGSGWWRAREALDEVDELRSAQGWPKTLRACFRGADGGRDAVINSFLTLRDESLTRLDDRDARIALGLFRGQRQVPLADELGLSQGSISRISKDKGIYALLRSHGKDLEDFNP